LKLRKGNGELRLRALDIVGTQVIDVHSIELNRIPWSRHRSQSDHNRSDICKRRQRIPMGDWKRFL